MGLFSPIGWILSGVWNWILGKFGMSPERRLGRLEVEEADDKATAKTQAAIDEKAINAPSNSDVDDRLGKGSA